ncbi:WD40/YVTN/BNR-like repeat-containing protein [Streptacidiphilus sp. EB103A]|uniref:WD40/YVTN/BNR-like repeat-containing protein n=1 Tax=Streptacidiphilus sp. EB103A TaxID=3156275 RepID=UPI0035180D15
MPSPKISRRGLMAVGAAAVATPLLSPAGRALAATSANSNSAQGSYTWKNAQIVGGGFVPGIIFNQSEQGLVYARTDIGGAYRLDRTTKRWVPLLDWIGWDTWGHTGVVSLATDSLEPDRVYAAVGTYTVGGWDPNQGAVLRSEDRGRTWKTADLPFQLGGNMPGRGMGERLAIDPHRNRILYLGVRGGHGLWRSEDYGKSWAQVTSFPNVGNFVPDPSDSGGYNSDNAGVLQVVFDPRDGRTGRATKTVYVTVADTENILYRSTDAGATWARVPGQPTGFLPHKAVFDHVSGSLYLATSNTVGPYDGSKGDVWKLDTATDTWTCISPVPSTSGNDGFGYSGLSIDRQNPDTLMVATQVSWWPDIVIYRSTDAGASWTRAWDFGNYPERTFRYSLDISAAPWLDFNATPALPETSPKLGWMTEALEIDPFDSDHFLYGTGATIYGADNLTAWDKGGTVAISVRAQGLEETAVRTLLSPPVGPPLLSGVSDVGGFVHTTLDRAYPMYANPTVGATNCLDYAELVPTTIVRSGSGGSAYLGLSTDSGATWTPVTAQPSGTTGPGPDEGAVALAADGGRIVWAPNGAAVSWSADSGATWKACTGIPTGTAVRSDRVDPKTFYGFAAGAFYRSTDGGASFTVTAAASSSGLPAVGPARFKAVPGLRGEIWLAGGADSTVTGGGVYGLWRSTDGGSTFTRISAVEEGDTIGFGKAAPGRSYPAVYTSASIHGVRGLYRSDDAGRHWARISDDRHQYGWTGSCIAGDPRLYGRVYVGTNGRGIVYGDVG